MVAYRLDSRASRGSDLDCRPLGAYPYHEGPTDIGRCFAIRPIRVVLGRLGPLYRLSAPELNVVEDGESIELVWERFLGVVSARDDAARLMFDVGPTRPQEMERGLDAPEDESVCVEAPQEQAQCARPRDREGVGATSEGLRRYDTTARTIEDVIASIVSDVPREEWDKLPPDLTDRLDDYLAGTPE